MTPREKEIRATDVQASRLSFPLQLVGTIAVVIVAILGSYYGTKSAAEAENSAMRSDIRVILEKMSSAEKLETVKERLEDERREALKARMDSYEREQKLLRLEFQQLREQLLLRK